MPGVKDEIGFQFVVVGAIVEVSQWCQMVPTTAFTQFDIDGPHDETGAVQLGAVQSKDSHRDAGVPRKSITFVLCPVHRAHPYRRAEI